MASLRSLASLEVVFTPWPTVKYKQLEIVLPLFLTPQATNLFLLRASSYQLPKEKSEAHWMTHFTKQEDSEFL